MTSVTAPPKAAVKLTPQPVGNLIDQLWALREKKRALETQIDDLTDSMALIEEELDGRMAAEGTTKATGFKASVSWTTSISGMPQGEEGWEQLYAFIAKKKMWHLLQRRISDPAYRELLASLNGGGELDLAKVKKQVPGLLPFAKKRLNLRALSA